MKIKYKQHKYLPDVRYIRTMKDLPMARQIKDDSVDPCPEYSEHILKTKGMTIEEEKEIEISRSKFAWNMLIGNSVESIIEKMGDRYPYSIKIINE